MRTRLEKEGYYKAAITPGFWSHKWLPIQFVLLVDDCIKYVGKEHAIHLLKTLEQNYEITTDWDGKKMQESTSLGIIISGTPIGSSASPWIDILQ